MVFECALGVGEEAVMLKRDYLDEVRKHTETLESSVVANFVRCITNAVPHTIILHSDLVAVLSDRFGICSGEVSCLFLVFYELDQRYSRFSSLSL